MGKHFRAGQVGVFVLSSELTHTHTFDPDWTQLNLVGNRIYFKA